MVAVLQLYHSMVYILACPVRAIGSSYYSSFTLKAIASGNQNCAASIVQAISNVVQCGWQLLLQRSLLCQDATNL